MDAFNLEWLETDRAAIAGGCSDICSPSHERAIPDAARPAPTVQPHHDRGWRTLSADRAESCEAAAEARLTIIDAKPDHLEIARPFLEGPAELRHQVFDPRSGDDGDLVVIPLSLSGDRRDVYGNPPAPAVLIHDWLWKTRGEGVRVSWLLLKRLNLVTR